jgi:isoamylase
VRRPNELENLPVRADPLGTTPSADGTNFAVASAGDQLAVCLFDPQGPR